MALFNMATAIDALEDLLDHERSMILSGKIEDLQRMAQEKVRLLSRLSGLENDAEKLKRVRRKTERNQELLAAAARGLKAATRRLEAIQKRDTNLRTYGRDGAPANLTRSIGGINHRA